MRKRIRMGLRTFISQSRARTPSNPESDVSRNWNRIEEKILFILNLILIPVFLSYSDHSYSLFWFRSFKQQTLGKDLQNHRSASFVLLKGSFWATSHKIQINISRGPQYHATRYFILILIHISVLILILIKRLLVAS